MSDWRPIETAPKDGTEFMAYGLPGTGPCGRSGEPELFFCGRTDIAGGFWYDTSGGPAEKPAHWQPLPELPK